MPLTQNMNETHSCSEMKYYLIEYSIQNYSNEYKKKIIKFFISNHVTF